MLTYIPDGHDRSRQLGGQFQFFSLLMNEKLSAFSGTAPRTPPPPGPKLPPGDPEFSTSVSAFPPTYFVSPVSRTVITS